MKANTSKVGPGDGDAGDAGNGDPVKINGSQDFTNRRILPTDTSQVNETNLAMINQTNAHATENQNADDYNSNEVHQLKMEFSETEDDNETISFIDLRKHIIAYHPHDNDQRFGLCDRLGDYAGCCDEGAIKPLAKEIGLGPSLFLITVRKVMCFFFVISILNVPVYLFLWFSNDTTPITLGDYMGKLSLGGITQTQTKCDSMNYASTETVKIQCNNQISQIESIHFLGIGSTKEAKCKTMLTSTEDELL